MRILLTICFISLLAGPCPAAARAARGQEPKPVMSEGFFLDGIEGVLQKSSTRPGEWTFRPLQKITMADEKEYPSGEPLVLLPCSVLEQMTKLAAGDPLLIRLWAMATVYKHSNSLYPVYFLPVKDSSAQPSQAEPPAEQDQAPPPAEEESILPMEILKQIQANAAPDLQKFQQVAQVTGDTNLIGRSGYLQDNGKEKIFTPDAFGRKIDLRRFTLLPAAAMESAEKQMNKTPGRQRYTVSGLVTTYKGKQYILLRSAERTYTHGNFTQ